MERCAEVYKEDARRVLSIDELIVSIKMLMEVGTKIESDLGLFMSKDEYWDEFYSNWYEVTDTRSMFATSFEGKHGFLVPQYVDKELFTKATPEGIETISQMFDCGIKYLCKKRNWDCSVDDAIRKVVGYFGGVFWAENPEDNPEPIVEFNRKYGYSPK